MQLGESAPKWMVEPTTGTAFECQNEVGGRCHELLGVGVRKLFLTPLYSIGLAAESAQLEQLLARTRFLSEHAELDQRFFSTLVDSPLDKSAFLVFHHDLPRERACDAVAEGLRRALGRRDEGRVSRVLGLLTRDLRKGDRIRFWSSENKVLNVQFEEAQVLEDRLLARGVWVPYLGADPLSVSLKQRIARNLSSRVGVALRTG